MQIALTDLSIKSLSSSSTIDVWDKKTPSFGIRVGPRSKTFIVKVGNSRQKIGSYPALSLQEARRAAQIRKTAKASTFVSPTFLEAYEDFRSLHIATKKGTTRENYEGQFQRHFLKPLGSKRLDDITYCDIIRITDKLSKSVQAYALSVIRIFWNWCRRRQITSNNPVDTVRIPVSTPRDRVLSDCELKCIWQACEPSTVLPHGLTSRSASSTDILKEDAERCAQPISPTFAAIVKLLILTGQRKSEIANLQSSWIKDQSICLPKHICKNGRAHQFPVGALGASLLRRRMATRSSGLLFPARGAPEKPFNGFSKSKAALDTSLGPDFEPWTLHDLRRTFASKMAELGVRIEITERLLNHVSGTQSGIVSVYQRYDYQREMREAVDKYDGFLQSLFARS